jgi:hypothetical protein
VLNSAKLGAFIKVIKCGTTKFGVKSSFDEEIYTSKLERGPNMDELEKKALKMSPSTHESLILPSSPLIIKKIDFY